MAVGDGRTLKHEVHKVKRFLEYFSGALDPVNVGLTCGGPEITGIIRAAKDTRLPAAGAAGVASREADDLLFVEGYWGVGHVIS